MNETRISRINNGDCIGILEVHYYHNNFIYPCKICDTFTVLKANDKFYCSIDGEVNISIAFRIGKEIEVYGPFESIEELIKYVENKIKNSFVVFKDFTKEEEKR